MQASRVRLGVLAVLQVLAKADSKALHPSWTALLPTSEAVRCSLGSQVGAMVLSTSIRGVGGSWVRVSVGVVVGYSLPGGGSAVGSM